MTVRSEVSTYFGKSISGFVANKFVVSISGMGFGNLRFYAKRISIPFETLLFNEDVYISDVTLARPKNVIAVQTHSEINMTFRMDPENTIIKELSRLFNTTHNINTFEATGTPALFNISIAVYGGNNSLKYSETFENCSVVSMTSYDLDASDRKLKEYEATFLCNRVGNKDYAGTKSGGKIAIQTTCQEIRDNYYAAKRKYVERMNKPLASQISVSDIDAALDTSNIIKYYIRLISNKPCYQDEKFVIGSEIPLGGPREYLKSRLAKGGVPAANIIDGTT